MKTLALLLLMFLNVGVLSAQTAVSYLSPVYKTTGTPTSGIASWQTLSCTTYTAVTSSTTTWGTAGTDSWYVLNSNVTINSNVTCYGNVHLILMNGYTLNTKTIVETGGTGNSFTVYAQDTAYAVMGSLNAYGYYETSSTPSYHYSAAGIGGGWRNVSDYGDSSADGSNITINGGKVSATGGTNGGAGIGGGFYDLSTQSNSSGSNITINGGYVTAIGTKAAGIGGGYALNAGNLTGSYITINGGNVTATGGGAAAGIGGGDAGSYITINGGNVTATGGLNGGAGIGGGVDAAGSHITIARGEVSATGYAGAAGIGGGKNGEGAYITISGGNVNAMGSDSSGYNGGAGIGGGYYKEASNISISGGSVTAMGGAKAAGIGGGNVGTGSDIVISGGSVTATGGSNAAGIGDGGDLVDDGIGFGGSDITITGGSVTANGGSDASGIGAGNIVSYENIFIADSILLKADGNNPPTTVIAHASLTTDVASSLADKQYATAVVRNSITPDTLDYLHFVSLRGGKLQLNKGGNNGSNLDAELEYSKDRITWTAYHWNNIYEGDEITTQVNDTVWFRAGGDSHKNAFFSRANLTFYYFKITNDSMAAGGNIMSLLDASCQQDSVPEYAFIKLFTSCSNLVSAPRLPAAKLASNCYAFMFYHCLALTTAPELPATHLAEACYNFMFQECSSLLEAPELPATTMKKECYSYMFMGCSSLTSAPELQSTNLAEDCYGRMFQNCDKLTDLPELPAEVLPKGCYYEMFIYCDKLKLDAVGPGKTWSVPASTDLGTDWNKNMFSGTAGTFTGAPTAGTVYYISSAPKVKVTKQVNDVAMGSITGPDSVYVRSSDTLVAVANAGFKFTGWDNGTTNDTLVISIDKDSTFTANFEEDVPSICSIGTTTYTTIADAIAAAHAGDTILMIADATENVTIASSDTLILDLNGKILKPQSNGSQTFTISGKLTLIDNSVNVKHYFSKAANGLWVPSEKAAATDSVTGGVITGATSKSAVLVKGGSFVMEQGNIVGNSISETGAGVYMAEWMEGNYFEMKGGCIVGNVAQYGGGVAACNGTFMMTGGEIRNNNAQNGVGGGVIVKNTGNFVMTGGKVTANTATDNGGGVRYEAGTVTLGGMAQITGNTTGTTANNLILPSGMTVGISSTAFAEGASIGVTTVSIPTLDNPVAITSNGAATDVPYFTPDNSNYVVNFSTNHLELTVPAPVSVCEIHNGTATVSHYATVQAAVNAASTGDTIRMIANSTENVSIYSNDTIILDLNGKILKPQSGEAQTIVVSGKLTLTDNSVNEKHYFSKAANGLWVSIEKAAATDSVTGGVITGSTSKSAVLVNGGSFVMEQGNIVGNSISETGAGVYMAEWMEGNYFEMKGGCIVGNVAQYGGGVAACNGTFTMTGGEICNNNAQSGLGGGVIVKNTGNFVMTGGKVTGNNATNYGGGVYFEAGAITLGGTAQITGNTMGTAECNLTLLTNMTFAVSNTAFANGANIGVTTSVLPTLGNPVAISSNGAATDVPYFTSDNSNYVVNFNTNNLELAVPVCEIHNGTAVVSHYATVQSAVNAASTGDTIRMIANSTENVTIASNDTLTLDLNGNVLKGAGSGSVVTVNGNASFTLTDGDSTAVHYYTVGGNGVWSWIASPTAAQTYGATAYDSLTARPASDAVIAVKGGAITGGTGNQCSGYTCGGGVLVAGNSGRFTMNGGNVVGNISNNFGGGVSVGLNFTGTAQINGGRIIGNVGICGGGIHGHLGSTLVVTGGDIAFNYASHSGGGIKPYAMFSMTGGQVRYNYSPRGGGLDCEAGSISILGGSIIHNMANSAGGVCILNNSTLTLGGDAQITANTLADGTTASNLSLSANKTFAVADAAFAEGANIGVTTGSTPTQGNPVAISSNGAATDVPYFTSDNSDFGVRFNSNHLELAVPVCEIHNGTAMVSHYVTVQSAVNAAATGDTIRMISNSTENVTIASNDTLTLDLNGNVLEGTGSGSVVTVSGNASFTLTDGDSTAVHYYKVGSYYVWNWIASPTAEQILIATDYDSLTARPAANAVIAVKGGAITGGAGQNCNGSNCGGGILVNGNNGTFTMNGGNVVGNRSINFGGGVSVGKDVAGTAQINGGRIIGNSSECGGGVHGHFNSNLIVSNGDIAFNNSQYGGGIKPYETLSMTGGQVRYNYSTTGGGGLHCEAGNISITGGSVTHNMTNGAGGVCILNNSTLTLGGNAQITANTLADGTTASNLWLQNGKTATISDVTPLNGANIGISTQNAPTVSTPIVVSSNGVQSDEQYFTADAQGKEVKFVNNRLALRYRNFQFTLGNSIDTIYTATARSVSVNVTTPATGATVQYSTDKGTTWTAGSSVSRTNAGTDTVKFKISAAGWADTITDAVVLNIAKRAITMTSSTDERPYNGEPLTNSNVTVSGDLFIEGEGATYNVTGSQTDAGSSDNTFTYTLKNGTLADNYDIDTTYGTLTVNAVGLSSCSIEPVSNQAYTGDSIKPGLNITLGSYSLVAGTDYTVSYINNVEIGTATVTATGIGNFTGTASKTFTIVPDTFLVTVNVNDPTMGSVTGGGRYPENSVVTLTATPSSNDYRFVSWSNGETTNPIQFMVTKDTTLTATFTHNCGAGVEVSDYDGNTYNTVSINGLCWISENLRSLHYADGSAVANRTIYSSDLCPDTAATLATYGRLYSWYSAVRVAEDDNVTTPTAVNGNVQGICPDGWHLPSQSELQALLAYTASELQSTTTWIGNPGNNSTGFNAVAAGYYTGIRFENLGGNTYFWSSTRPADSYDIPVCSLQFGCSEATVTSLNGSYKLSVRCVKNK